MNIATWALVIVGGILVLYALAFVVVSIITSIVNSRRMHDLQLRMILDDQYLTDEWREKILDDFF